MLNSSVFYTNFAGYFLYFPDEMEPKAAEFEENDFPRPPSYQARQAVPSNIRAIFFGIRNSPRRVGNPKGTKPFK